MRTGFWSMVAAFTIVIGCSQSHDRVSSTPLAREEAEALAREAANEAAPVSSGFVYAVADARRERDGWMIRLHDREQTTLGGHCRVFVGDDRSVKVIPGK